MINAGFSDNNKISHRQLQALIFLEVFGFGVTALPGRVAQAAGAAGWLSVLLGLLFILPSVLIMAFARGRALGKVFGIILALRLALLSGQNLRMFTDITRHAMLNNTPRWFICAAILLLAAYGASKGMEVRARAAELLIPIALLPVIGAFIFTLPNIDINNLRPAAIEPVGLIHGALHTYLAFSGIELILLYKLHLSKKPKASSIMAAALLIGLLLLAVTALAIARFGPDDILHRQWPVLRLMESSTANTLERQGALAMTFWLISAFAHISGALYFIPALLTGVSRGRPLFIALTMPVIALAAAFAIDARVGAGLAIFTMSVMPILLCLKGVKPNEE